MFYKYSTFCAKKNIRKPKPNTPPLKKTKKNKKNHPPPKKNQKQKTNQKIVFIVCLDLFFSILFNELVMTVMGLNCLRVHVLIVPSKSNLLSFLSKDIVLDYNNTTVKLLQHQSRT